MTSVTSVALIVVLIGGLNLRLPANKSYVSAFLAPFAILQERDLAPSLATALALN